MTGFSSDLLKLEMRNATAVLTLNRPEKRNAVNDRLIEDLHAFFAAPPAEAKAVVICGAGDHFCAGLDLAEHKERKLEDAVYHSRFWHKTFNLMQFGGLPVLSAMHGAVMGGGLELATSTHVRIAEPNVIYQLPEGRRGIFVGGGASVRVSRIVGPDRMTEMMLTGRRIYAEEGQALGLSHYLVGAGEAVDKAVELADTISGNAPLANYMMIHAISRIHDMSREDGLFAEALAATLTTGTEDAKAGLQAFLDKRDIRFDKKKK